MHVDLKTELHLVAEIPQSCDCSDTLCVKLMTREELARLTQTERNRVWTLHAHNGKNWLNFGVSTARDVRGYILLPLKVKLPDDVLDEEATRPWTCASCGFETEVTYTELVESGRPHCDDCEVDMDLVRPPTPEAETTPEATAETANAEAPAADTPTNNG